MLEFAAMHFQCYFQVESFLSSNEIKIKNETYFSITRRCFLQYFRFYIHLFSIPAYIVCVLWSEGNIFGIVGCVNCGGIEAIGIGIELVKGSSG